ncbi:glycosylphosphatidylinositol anchor biosynthesis [Coemansia javaensis]|uniref:Glycosylphosphatidylinositol anchor biosynthesis n=1 Tax=Coemansia javaensis TaxID=2761396 RepID=A0A9W8HEE9_9FUNG|nr:glycosylphosphatidylinositol anchor biosynthesis [Coemansia javaensis]
MPPRLSVPFRNRRRDAAAAAAAESQLAPLGTLQEADDDDATAPRPAAAARADRPPGHSDRPPPAQSSDQPAAAADRRDPGAARARRPWRRLLYIQQDYADDYVDSTFLRELQKNANVRMYDYSAVVMQTTVVSQHISSIMVFIAVFINLYRGALTASTLLWCSSAATAVGVAAWDVLGAALHTPVERIARPRLIKGAVLFALLLFGLSPILRTLTEDTSSDTIWAMTVFFFCVNLAFHDYSTGNLTNIRFPGSVSLNAAVLASVLLASQLDSNLSVFAFLSFALQWFALFPIFRRYLKRISAATSVAATVALALVAAAMFASILRAVAMLFVACTLFITFGCPLWLIWVQRYKNEIHGPWDEARPVVHGYFG